MRRLRIESSPVRPNRQDDGLNRIVLSSIRELFHKFMGAYGGPRRRVSYAHTREWHRGHVPYKCCKGSHIAITGAAAGIGLELAKEAIARGAGAVSIIDLSDCSKALRELRDCAADGLSMVFLTKVESFQADVSSFEQVRELLFLGCCSASPATLPGHYKRCFCRYPAQSRIAKRRMGLWTLSLLMLASGLAVRVEAQLQL